MGFLPLLGNVSGIQEVLMEAAACSTVLALPLERQQTHRAKNAASCIPCCYWAAGHHALHHHTASRACSLAEALVGAFQSIAEVRVDVGFDGLRGLAIEPIANLFQSGNIAILAQADELVGQAFKRLAAILIARVHGFADSVTPCFCQTKSRVA